MMRSIGMGTLDRSPEGNAIFNHLSIPIYRLVVLRTVFAICASSFGVSFSSDLHNYRYYVTIVISAKEGR